MHSNGHEGVDPTLGKVPWPEPRDLAVLSLSSGRSSHMQHNIMHSDVWHAYTNTGFTWAMTFSQHVHIRNTLLGYLSVKKCRPEVKGLPYGLSYVTGDRNSCYVLKCTGCGKQGGRGRAFLLQ